MLTGGGYMCVTWRLGSGRDWWLVGRTRWQVRRGQRRFIHGEMNRAGDRKRPARGERGSVRCATEHLLSGGARFVVPGHVWSWRGRSDLLTQRLRGTGQHGRPVHVAQGGSHACQFGQALSNRSQLSDLLGHRQAAPVEGLGGDEVLPFAGYEPEVGERDSADSLVPELLGEFERLMVQQSRPVQVA